MQKWTLIWVDDERSLPKYAKNIFKDVIICRTYRQTISALNNFFNTKNHGHIFIDLDHDLQCKQTGYDVAKYIVEHHLPIDGFNCHSFNPVGRKNIEQLLLHYGYKIGI